METPCSWATTTHLKVASLPGQEMPPPTNALLACGLAVKSTYPMWHGGGFITHTEALIIAGSVQPLGC